MSIDERTHAGRDSGIFVERPRVGIHASPAGVLGDLDRSGLAEDRKSIKGWIVHPYPNRKSSDRKRIRAFHRKIHRLFFGDVEWNAATQLLEQPCAPRPGSHDQTPRAILDAAGADHDFSAATIHRVHRHAFVELRSVFQRHALVCGRRAFRRNDPAIGLKERLDVVVDSKLWPAAADFGRIYSL